MLDLKLTKNRYILKLKNIKKEKNTKQNFQIKVMFTIFDKIRFLKFKLFFIKFKNMLNRINKFSYITQEKKTKTNFSTIRHRMQLVSIFEYYETDTLNRN